MLRDAAETRQPACDRHGNPKYPEPVVAGSRSMRTLARRGRRRAGCRSRCLRERSATAGGAVKGPNDSARSNDPGTRTAPEVRDTPKKLTATPHEMTTNVMEPGASSCAVMVRSTGFLIFRQQGRAHLNVIEQSRFAGLAPRAIEAFKLLRPLR